jgi:ABC-type antimicrobial peptide transport system permease subunit
MILWETGDSILDQVVGVVTDFVIESPFQQTINPMMIFGPGQMYSQILHIRLNPARATSAAMAGIEKIFKKYNPDYPLEYAFVDESYAKKFDNAQRTGKLAALFAGLTILISCLGLFGLATYMAENRIKEIGIRKVLGASVTGIASLLSFDFLKLVGISFIIAAPVAWWAMSKWLQTYTYRITIEWWVFALAAVLSVLIAIITVSFQAIKAAMANPVKSLRSE